MKIKSAIKSSLKSNPFFGKFLKLFAGSSISKILGFLRELVFSALLGTGRYFDALVIALSVPTLFRRILGEDMFENVIGPHFKKLRSEGRHDKAYNYLKKSVFFITLLLVVITVILYYLAPIIIQLIAPGFDDETLNISLKMLKVLVFYIALMSAATFTGAILYFSGAKKRFESKYETFHAAGPAMWNLSIIIFIYLSYDKIGFYALPFGFLSGAFVFFVFQLPYLIRIIREISGKYKVSVKKDLLKNFKDGLTIFGKSLINNSIGIVDKLVASLTTLGAVSSLWLSFRLINLPISLFSLSVAKPCASGISGINKEEIHNEINQQKIRALVHKSIKWILYLITPVFLLFIFQSKPIVYIVFKRGEFNYNDVVLVAHAFFWYSYAILPMGLIVLFSRIYTSLGKYNILLKASIFGAVTNIVLDLILYNTSLKHGGIALATSIASVVNMLILGYGLRLYIDLKKISLVVKNLIIASFIASIPLAILHLFNIEETQNWIHILLITFIVSIISLLIYGVMILHLGVKKGNDNKLRVILSGGGTGGHVYPAIAILRMIEKEDKEVEKKIYVGIKGKAEEKIVSKFKDIELRFTKSEPVSGLSFQQKIRNLIIISIGTLKAFKILIKEKPNLVIGTGGYASAPVIFAAYLLRPFLKLKIVLHEQNIVPGLLNKVSSLFADVVLISFIESSHYLWTNKIVDVGYPLKPDFYEQNIAYNFRNQLNLPENRFILLIVGGSLGSRSINRAICESILELIKVKNILILHSTGLYNTKEYNAYLDTKTRIEKKISSLHDYSFKEKPNSFRIIKSGDDMIYESFPYIFDFYKYQQAADLIISRAGAGAIAEIMALKKASILVPKRGLPGDHQELNAINIAEKKASLVIFEFNEENGIDKIYSEQLLELIKDVKNKNELREHIKYSTDSLRNDNVPQNITNTIKKVMKDQSLIQYVNQLELPKFIKFSYSFDSLITYIDNLASKEKITFDPQIEKILKKDDYLSDLIFSDYRKSFYAKMYSNKIDEFLSSDNYLIKNKAVKLIGALKLNDKYTRLVKIFDQSQGYIRRNILIALNKSDKWYPYFAPVIIQALEDNYFEVRREAVRISRTFISDLVKCKLKDSLLEKIEKSFNRRFESFEVKSEIIKLLVLIKPEKEIYQLYLPYTASKNEILKQAVLEALHIGIEKNKIKNLDLLNEFMNKLVIINSAYRSDFYLRKKYSNLLKLIEERF